MGAVTRRSSLPDAEAQGLAGARRHKPDYWLLILSALLLAIGLIVVYAISPALAVEKNVSANYFIGRQLMWVGLGLVVFAITARVPLDFWRKAGVPLLVAAGIITLFALVLPVNAQYPAHRWIRLGGLSFQSVELLKFALLIWLAAFLTKRIKAGQVSDVRLTIRPLIIIIGVVGAIVAFVQSDLGSAGVIVAITGIMAMVAGLPMKRILMIGAIIGIGTILAISITPYRRDRLTSFLHPEANCLTSGYQACQALIAVGSGGMIGLGLGRSVQAFGYLPEAENDSIFAIYSEKFGFLGVTVLLGLLVAFLGRIKRIMERAPDDFTRLVIVGVFVWFAVQSLINVGAMIGLLPLKGITLPFISYGGTSILFVMAAVGLVFQVSRYTLYSVPRSSNVSGGGRDYEDRSDRRRIRGAYHPNPGSRA